MEFLRISATHQGESVLEFNLSDWCKLVKCPYQFQPNSIKKKKNSRSSIFTVRT